MARMEILCGSPKCERCGKESVITILHKSYNAELCRDCYEDANKNKELFLTGVEFVPVVHAHWEELVYSGGKLFFRCSNCGHGFTPVHGHTYNYCFCCGAKMDEEVG